MSAAPIPENACPNCGEPLPSKTHFCANCGAPVGELPPLEPTPGPVAHQRVEPRWLGIPARFFLLCLAFAAVGAAIGLFATGSWGWGIAALLVAVIVFVGLREAVRQNGGLWNEQPARIADGRAQAATAAEVWRTRLETSVTRWRTQSQLGRIDAERGPVLQDLGDAVVRGDAAAEKQARERLEQLDDERRRVEEELGERLAGADEKIRRARLPVQETMMVTPTDAGSTVGEAAGARQEDGAPDGAPGPSTPYPPPDEGNPPQPATIPEPYPPPDEGTPPTPDPGQPADE